MLERAEDVAARRQQGLVIVVERLGWLVATCTLAPRQATPGAMLLSRFAVHPTAQRQGIGNDVLKELVALLVARGVTTVAGFSLHQMQTAHRLYQRLGAHPTHYAHGTHYELNLIARP
nr:GNAT family N-acetyltransferase [Kocuria salina]